MHDLPPFPPEPPNPQSPSPTHDHRRNGKVAKLPKATRDHINQMLEDGLTYTQIIDHLGPHGRGLTLDNLSQWKKGGYQDWLRDQFWRDNLLSRQEALTGLLAAAEPLQLPEVGLQVAVMGICELLRDLCQDPAERKNDSDKFVRVANSLARLSRSIVQLQHYRHTTAQAHAADLKLLDHKRNFTDAERQGILDRADNLFGFKSAHRLQAESHPPDLVPPVSQITNPDSADSEISNSEIPNSEILNPEISNPEPPNPEPAAPEPSTPSPQSPSPLCHLLFGIVCSLAFSL
jgi:hypothetical protein